MNTPKEDGQALARAAADALRRGDARNARDLFLRAAQSGQADIGVMLGLAYSCRALEDWAGMVASVDRVLAADSRNVRALIMKGDGLERGGDARGAAAHYRAALRVAPPAEQLPPDLVQELRRAQQASEQFTKRYEEHLRSWMKQRGVDAKLQGPSRFEQSLDVLIGRQRIYLQEPRYFYFPQLSQQPFWDRAAFPWLEALEAAAPAIRAELDALLQDAAAFTPYVKGDPSRPPQEQRPLADNPAWSACHLWRNGAPVETHAARCPQTMAALAGVPLAQMPQRAPTVMFCKLDPGTLIPPRNGLINTRLIVHLPLIVPGKCHLRVGGEVRELVEGQAWVIDDSIEHEAVNQGTAPRVMLVFDIPRPDISAEEHRNVAALLEGVDAFVGQPPGWEI
jgi:aspartyl/asparaginyl beta-hydroxylase (cupin superfamily)